MPHPLTYCAGQGIESASRRYIDIANPGCTTVGTPIFLCIRKISGEGDRILKHLNSKTGSSTKPLSPTLEKTQNRKNQWVPDSELKTLMIYDSDTKSWGAKGEVIFVSGKGRRKNTWADPDLSRVLTTHKTSCQTGWKDLMLIMKLASSLQENWGSRLLPIPLPQRKLSRRYPILNTRGIPRSLEKSYKAQKKYN